MALDYLLIVLVCLVLSAFFSSSETALLRVRPDELDEKGDDQKSLSTAATKALIKSPSKLLVTILLGNNVVNILGASCASMFAVYFLGEQKGVFVATVVMTIAVLVFSEIIPKALASRDPLRVAHLVALPLYMMHQLSRPLHIMFEKFLDPLITRLVGTEKQSADINAHDTLLRLASRIRMQKPELGPISIIQSTVKAQKLCAGDVMVPKSEIFAIDHMETIEKALEQMLMNRFTRTPIYKGNLDSMQGLVHFKDLVQASRVPDSTISQILRPVLRVPEKKPILSLLADMQQSSIHVAIVKDEFGNTEGIVTQEDILEELIGEIRDEFDSEELNAIHKLSDSSYRLLSKVPVRDFNRESGWHLLASENETVGGLLFNQLGRIPKVGEEVLAGDYKLKVLEMSGHRIVQVKIESLVEINPTKES